MTDKPEAAAPGPAAPQPTPAMIVAMLEQKRLRALAERALLDDQIRALECQLQGARAVIDAGKAATTAATTEGAA